MEKLSQGQVRGSDTFWKEYGSVYNKRVYDPIGFSYTGALFECLLFKEDAPKEYKLCTEAVEKEKDNFVKGKGKIEILIKKKAIEEKTYKLQLKHFKESSEKIAKEKARMAEMTELEIPPEPEVKKPTILYMPTKKGEEPMIIFNPTKKTKAEALKYTEEREKAPPVVITKAMEIDQLEYDIKYLRNQIEYNKGYAISDIYKKVLTDKEKELKSLTGKTKPMEIEKTKPKAKVQVVICPKGKDLRIRSGTKSRGIWVSDVAYCRKISLKVI
jgi:hypothetical protein